MPNGSGNSLQMRPSRPLITAAGPYKPFNQTSTTNCFLPRQQQAKQQCSERQHEQLVVATATAHTTIGSQLTFGSQSIKTTQKEFPMELMRKQSQLQLQTQPASTEFTPRQQTVMAAPVIRASSTYTNRLLGMFKSTINGTVVADDEKRSSGSVKLVVTT